MTEETMDAMTNAVTFEPKPKPWHGFVLKKEISVTALIAFLLSMVLGSYGFVRTFGKLEATLIALVDKVQIQQGELDFLRGLPERVAKVEERIEKNNQQQIETLGEIKTLIVQSRPKNSTPSLQKRQ